MHLKCGSYYYVTKDRKWLKLSRSYREALTAWADIEGVTLTGSTVANAIDRYLLQCMESHADATKREYLRISARLRDTFGAIHLDDVRPHHVAQYLDRHPSKSAANKEVGMLSSNFTFAMRWGWCMDNPCKKVRKHSEPRRTRYIQDSEFAAVRTLAWEHENENGEHPWRSLAVAMDISYLTAFRLTDVIGIKLSDIQENELRIVEGKTKWKARAIMSDELRVVIERATEVRRRVSSIYLIVQREGMPYSSGDFKSAWQRLQRHALTTGAIVERFHFHDIRAKHATDADEIGINAQLALGHVDAATTKRYIRHLRGRKIMPLKGIKGGR
jgi:integrase